MAGRDRSILDIKHKDILICQYENFMNLDSNRAVFRAFIIVWCDSLAGETMRQVI